MYRVHYGKAVAGGRRRKQQVNPPKRFFNFGRLSLPTILSNKFKSSERFGNSSEKRSGIWKAIDNKRTERKTFRALSSCETEKSAESLKVEVSIKTLIEINANSKMFLDPTPLPS